MIPIKNKKPVKIGNSYFFHIPVKFIDPNLIDKDKSYNIEVNNISKGNKTP